MDMDTDVYHRYQIDTNMLLPIDTQNIWVSVGGIPHDGYHEVSDGYREVSDGYHKVSDEYLEVSHGYYEVSDGYREVSNRYHEVSNGYHEVAMDIMRYQLGITR